MAIHNVPNRNFRTNKQQDDVAPTDTHDHRTAAYSSDCVVGEASRPDGASASIDRFEFGENWKRFLNRVDEGRIERAIESLQTLLGMDTLRDKRFLDLGSGSGLFSLAAHRLGAIVTSVDYDPQCVACTQEIRQRLADRSGDWDIIPGDALDESFMQSLGRFDVVYSWGVLHHTGDMHTAIANASEAVQTGGTIALAIYNDMGGSTRRWKRIKVLYHRLPRWLRPILVGIVATFYETKFALARLASGKNPLPMNDWAAKQDDRGMSVWHDWVDWVGGLPFEAATPETIIGPLLDRGFELTRLSTTRGWGCNEFVFRRKQPL